MLRKVLFSIMLVFVVVFSFGYTADAKTKKVVLYTAHKSEIIEAMTKRFKADTGIEAEVIKMTSGEIIQRAVAERNNPQADVIWSIGGEQLEANSDILASYTPKDWDKVSPLFKVGNKWFPYTAIVMVFIVNKEMLNQEDMPKRWTDLGNLKYRGTIASARADKSGSSYMQLATVINIYKDKGWEIYKSILTNFILFGNSSAVCPFVNDGEVSVGITLEDNAYRFVKGGGPVTIVYPEDGTTAAPDGLALVRNGPNPSEGKSFIDWALGKKTQEFLVHKMGRRSVRTDVAPSGDLPSLNALKTVPYDIAWSAGNKNTFVKRWRSLVMELGL